MCFMGAQVCARTALGRGDDGAGAAGGALSEDVQVCLLFRRWQYSLVTCCGRVWWEHTSNWNAASLMRVHAVCVLF